MPNSTNPICGRCTTFCNNITRNRSINFVIVMILALALASGAILQNRGKLQMSKMVALTYVALTFLILAIVYKTLCIRKTLVKSLDYNKASYVKFLSDKGTAFIPFNLKTYPLESTTIGKLKTHIAIHWEGNASSLKVKYNDQVQNDEATLNEVRGTGDHSTKGLLLICDVRTIKGE